MPIAKKPDQALTKGWWVDPDLMGFFFNETILFFLKKSKKINNIDQVSVRE
jgi:hypothetical protein